MKLADGMKKISDGWVRKPNGFRVKYEKIIDSETIVDYSPGLDDTPLDSDDFCMGYSPFFGYVHFFLPSSRIC